jgi:site-specific DNA-methyltransferase (adenine-specific)
MEKVIIGKATLYLGDCMDGMKGLPDKAFDLAIVDPEFGIGIGNSPRLVTDKGLKAKAWDDKPIDDNYFTELFRATCNQIIFGGNYYALPGNKHCIAWDKLQPEKLSFGMFDYAWTSFNGANKMFRKSVQDEKNKIHPTQKPVRLYSWILANYTAPGDTIMDTHMGSGSSVIACLDRGHEVTAYEIDPEYFEAACLRIEQSQRQLQLAL